MFLSVFAARAFVVYSSKCDCTHWHVHQTRCSYAYHNQQAFWWVGMQSKKTFNLKQIVKKFSMNLKKTRWKFERAVETIREEN